jgi:hypothetical protein
MEKAQNTSNFDYITLGRLRVESHCGFLRSPKPFQNNSGMDMTISAGTSPS